MQFGIDGRRMDRWLFNTRECACGRTAPRPVRPPQQAVDCSPHRPACYQRTRPQTARAREPSISAAARAPITVAELTPGNKLVIEIPVRCDSGFHLTHRTAPRDRAK